MKKEFETTINITQMDRDTVDYFTLSEILEMYSDVSGVIINSLDYDYSASIYYAETGLGRVIFPRHLNETLEDIEDLMNDEDPFRFAFHPYSYTFGDRHGYSAKFYILDATVEYKDTDSVIVSHNKEHIKETINKLYGSSLYGKVAREVIYEKCEYTNDPCFEHDCDLCPYNPYQE